MNSFFKSVKAFVKATAQQCGALSKKAIEYVCKGKDMAVKGVKRLAHSNLEIKLSAIAASFCLVAAGTITACGFTMSYGVSYNGKTIAYVAEKSVVEQAMVVVADKLQNEEAFSYINEVEYTLSIGGEKEASAEEIATALLDSTAAIAKCANLIVDGKIVLSAFTVKAVEDALQSRLDSFKIAGTDQKIEYLDKYDITEGYCLKDDITADWDIPSAIECLSVQSVSTVTYSEEVDYKTVTQKTSNYDVNYKRVTKSGVKGENGITARIVSINGVEQSREVISTTVVKEPVDEIVLQGTAKVKTTAKKSAKAGTFLWPLAKAEKQYISSYFGDGRGHKGWDICSPKGTDIYASASGKVITSGWSKSGYGKYIIIDHGNSYSTLYSHCSELYVKVGDTVSAGQVIAAVGRTGRATANHLHFEVRLNGVAQNPGRYF